MVVSELVAVLPHGDVPGELISAFRFGIDPESESVSVGGWVMERLGKIPEIGDRFTCGDLSILVTAVDGQRITEIVTEPVLPPGNGKEKEPGEPEAD